MIGTVNERLTELRRMYPEYRPHTLWTRFRENAQRYKDRVFLAYQDKEYTYGEMLRKTEEMALSLYAAGVRAGDRVAVVMPNCPEYIELIFGIAMLGAVKVSVNIKLSEKEMLYVIRSSKAECVISSLNFEVSACCTAKDVKVWIMPQNLKQFMAQSTGVSRYYVSAYSERHQDPMSPAEIMFTSGSTKAPKGTVLTHDMVLRSSFGTVWSRRMEEGRRIFVPIPLYHVMAYNEALLPIIYVGGTMIMADRKYSAKNMAYLMKKHHANDIVCVSYVMMDFLQKEKPEPEEYPSIHAAYWASTCPDWVWEEGRRRFNITDVTTGYGMTECGSTTSVSRPEDPDGVVSCCHGALKEAGPMGNPAWGGRLLELKIADPDTGEDLGFGKTGEILCRGLTVTPGYLSEAENLTSFTEDGWFKTGDLGILREDGRLAFEGRMGDAYKINGETVSAFQIDHILGGCNLVEAVETVGISEERYGECGVSFVDTGDYSDEKLAAISGYCKTNLAAFQIPKYLIFGSQENWPKTGSGKFIKRELRKIAGALCKENSGSAFNGQYLVKQLV